MGHCSARGRAGAQRAACWHEVAPTIVSDGTMRATSCLSVPLLFLVATALGCSASTEAGSGSGAAGVGGSTATGVGSTGVGTGGAVTAGAGAAPAASTGATSGGAPGTTSGATSGGMGGTGATTGGTGGTTTTACTFNVTQSMSPMIPTVGIVEFSVDLPVIDGATIEYGLDTSYGMSAPVDLAEPGYRTLLLGMKTQHEYHFRVSATSGGQQCQSEDFSLTTGELPNVLGLPTVTTMGTAEQLAGGFLITARWGMNNDGPAFILDADNDIVWLYNGEIDVIRARMTYDGKAMWIRNTAQEDGTGVIHRVSMDGLNDERWEVPRTTHDLAVIPDGKLGLIAHTEGCDEVVEFDPSNGTLTSIFNVEQAHGQTDCHVNYLAYSSVDDSFYVSDWTSSTYIKISRTGQLLWVLNGDAATISGTSWSRQHGIHVLAPDHLLIFSNGEPGASSLGLEYMLDEASGTATELWRYDSGVQAQFGGDIQRLDNGNTLITYSSAGVIQELDPEHALLQELTFPIGTTVSYAVKRASLYGGPPPKIQAMTE